jgi:hypothetical protein
LSKAQQSGIAPRFLQNPHKDAVNVGTQMLAAETFAELSTVSQRSSQQQGSKIFSKQESLCSVRSACE